MAQQDRIALLTKATTHFNQYISQADRKASILLSGHLAYIGFFVSSDFFKIGDLVSQLPVLLSSLTVLTAIIVVIPRMRDDNRDTSMLGNLHWGEVAEASNSQFVEEITSTDVETGLSSLAASNQALAKVLRRKYRWLRISMFGTVATLISSFLVVMVD